MDRGGWGEWGGGWRRLKEWGIDGGMGIDGWSGGGMVK